jgi:hypothetical protein
VNAPAKQSHFASPFGAMPQGVLLFAGFQMTDTLQVDLYGERPTHDEGHVVQGVTVAGHGIDISELISGRQLDKLGEWLDHKDVMGELPQRVAANAKHEAMRIKF